MGQTFETLVSGTTTFGQLYAKINNLVEALRSAFSGASFPTTPSPVEGQFCYRTDLDKLYVFVDASWKEVATENTGLGAEIINARGTKPTLDQRLDVAVNEDGTLKAATTLNPSQWHKPSLTFTYVSTTSFTVNGDQRDIYKPTRRLKINLTASTVYSEVVSATYTTVTTITVLDAVINNTLIDVEHSLFLPTKDSGALSLEMLAEHVKTVTAEYTTSINDSTVFGDATAGAFNINIISAATLGAGRRQTFKKVDAGSNVITLVAAGTEKFDGFSKLVLEKFGQSVTIESDGANFRIIDNDSNKLTAADLISDYVVSGLLGVDPGALLTMTIPGGTVYVMGVRVVKPSSDADITKTYTASKDTYVDISNTGAITYSEVANGAAVPAVAANSIRTQKVITNATEITGVTDLRVLISRILRYALATETVAGTDYTANLPASVQGLEINIKFPTANTSTAPTLNVKKIFKEGGAALATGDIPAGHHGTLSYDTALDAAAGGWILKNPKAASKILHVRDEKTLGTQGGSSVNGIQTRVLNTVVLNEIAGASLAANQVTLPAGTYKINCKCPSLRARKSQAGLYNVTDSILVLYGEVLFGENTASAAHILKSEIWGKFTISAQKVFEVRQYIENALVNEGLGSSSIGAGISGTEVYSELLFEKV